MPGRTAARRAVRAVGATAVLGLLAACGPDQLPVGAPTPIEAGADIPTTTTTTVADPAPTAPRRATTTTTTTTTPPVSVLVRPAGPPEPEGRYLSTVFATGDVAVERKLVYGHAPRADDEDEDVDLALDLYQPSDDPIPQRPVVVLVHGGGFVSGDRTALEAYARDLARRGWVVAAVSYRLSDGVGSDWRGEAVRAAVTLARHDVAAAVRWLRAGADEWGLDPDRIAVVGYSAGAMTAIEVALHDDDPGDSGTPDEPSDVDAVVSIAGTVVAPEDVHAPAPPMLLLHGDADRSVSHDLAESTCALAVDAGIDCTLETFPDVGHEIVSSRRSAVLEASVAFLVEALALPTA